MLLYRYRNLKTNTSNYIKEKLKKLTKNPISLETIKNKNVNLRDKIESKFANEINLIKENHKSCLRAKGIKKVKRMMVNLPEGW